MNQAEEARIVKSSIMILVLLAIAGTANAQEHSGGKTVDSVQPAIDLAVAKARLAINKYGETDSAMVAIQAVLSEVASLPGIKTRGQMKVLHGSKSMGRALLARESDSGICLYLSWFGKGAETPVHDHLTWGVVRVLEGRDRYTRWRHPLNSKSDELSVKKGEQRVLAPGESTFWLGPPNDVHSQQAVDSDLWELVMTGRDLSSDYVTKNHHYYDAKSGRVSSSNPQIDAR